MMKPIITWYLFMCSAMILFLVEAGGIMYSDKGYLVRLGMSLLWFISLIVTCSLFAKYKEEGGWPWKK